MAKVKLILLTTVELATTDIFATKSQLLRFPDVKLMLLTTTGHASRVIF
jgi:hypothetical protein